MILVIRPYTPIDPEEGGYFDLIVKNYPDGKMSSYIHSLSPGDSLEIKGPIQKWQYPGANSVGHIGMIAGGSGITPMIQIMQKVLSDPKDKTKLTLIFGNLTENDLVFKEEFDQLVAKHPDQVKIFHTLDKAPKNWSQGIGHVDAKMVTQLMPKPGQGKIMVCGPPGMMNAISGPKAKDFTQGEIGGVLKTLGYTMDDVYKF